MMTLKEFTYYTNIPYHTLNKTQQEFIDTIDYAEQNNLQITWVRSRSGYLSNIMDIYRKMQYELRVKQNNT